MTNKFKHPKKVCKCNEEESDEDAEKRLIESPFEFGHQDFKESDFILCEECEGIRKINN